MPRPEGLIFLFTWASSQAGNESNLTSEAITTTGQKSRLIYNLFEGILKPHVLFSPRRWEGSAHLDLFWNMIAKRTNMDVSVVTLPVMLGGTKSSVLDLGTSDLL